MNDTRYSEVLGEDKRMIILRDNVAEGGMSFRPSNEVAKMCVSRGFLRSWRRNPMRTPLRNIRKAENRRERWANRTFPPKPKRWRSGDFNFCMANVSKNNIRSMQTSTGIAANGKELSKADLISIPADGYVFSGAELDALSSGEQLLVVEARQINNLVVSVELDGDELYSYAAPLCISSVREMYRWLNERYASGDNGGEPSQLGSPWNRPDEECDGKHFVFVHGYNVNAADARVWADQMFKRLWWSGSKSMFTAVDWREEV